MNKKLPIIITIAISVFICISFLIFYIYAKFQLKNIKTKLELPPKAEDKTVLTEKALKDFKSNFKNVEIHLDKGYSWVAKIKFEDNAENNTIADIFSKFVKKNKERLNKVNNLSNIIYLYKEDRYYETYKDRSIEFTTIAVQNLLGVYANRYRIKTSDRGYCTNDEVVKKDQKNVLIECKDVLEYFFDNMIKENDFYRNINSYCSSDEFTETSKKEISKVEETMEKINSYSAPFYFIYDRCCGKDPKARYGLS